MMPLVLYLNSVLQIRNSWITEKADNHMSCFKSKQIAISIDSANTALCHKLFLLSSKHIEKRPHCEK